MLEPMQKQNWVVDSEPPCSLLAQEVPVDLGLPVVAVPAVEQVVLVAAVGLELAWEGLEVAAVPEELVAEVAVVGSLPLLPLA